MFDNFTNFGKTVSMIFLTIVYLAMITLCFYGGTFVDPFIGLSYSGFPILIGIIISVFYITVSIENKKLHPFVFCCLLLFLSSCFGSYYIKTMTNRLVKAGNAIENHSNDISLKGITINKNFDIKQYGDGYFTIKYKNEDRFHYDSKYGKIFFRNIP